MQAAKNDVILTAGLSRSLAVEDIVSIVEMVRQAPENIRVLWNLANADMKILDKSYSGTPHYDPSERGIRFNIATDRAGIFHKPYKSVFHELGHLIDRFMNEKFQSVVYKGGLFGDTLRAEAAKYVRLTTERLKLRMGTKIVTESKVYKEINRELLLISEENLPEVSDIWHGVTQGKVDSGHGHYDFDYWTRNGGVNLPKEAFAHMFRAIIQNPESLVAIKKYFPKSYGIFEDMISDFLKEAVK